MSTVAVDPATPSALVLLVRQGPQDEGRVFEPAGEPAMFTGECYSCHRRMAKVGRRGQWMPGEWCLPCQPDAWAPNKLHLDEALTAAVFG